MNSTPCGCQCGPEKLPSDGVHFNLDGQEVDVLDLKTLLVTRGINMPEEIADRLGRTHRLAPASNPYACNCLLLPGNIPAHMFHVGPSADFGLAVTDTGRPCVTYRGKFVTEVDLPPATDFYRQHTSSGYPFNMMAILQGLDVYHHVEKPRPTIAELERILNSTDDREITVRSDGSISAD